MASKKDTREGARKKTKPELPDAQRRDSESTISVPQHTYSGDKSDQKDLDVEYNCGKCKIRVGDDEPGLCCDVCDLWYHIQCENLPKQIYDFMVKEEAGKQLNWTCSFCERGYGKMNKMLKRICSQQDELAKKYEIIEAEVLDTKESVKENLAQVKDGGIRMDALEAKNIVMSECIEKEREKRQELVSRMEQLEKKMSTISVDTSAPTQETSWRNTNSVTQTNEKQMQTEDAISEWNRRRMRENNIVVFGIPETTSERIEERVEGDRIRIKEILDTCEISDGQVKIEKIIRLGKSRMDKKRPILVKFTDSETKIELYRNIKKLRDDDKFKEIQIKNDMTKLERDRELALYRESKNLTTTNNEGAKYRVRGPPWNRRIVKMAGTQ